MGSDDELTADMLFRRAFSEPPPLADVAPHVHAALAGVVAKALVRLPTERFQTAAEFADDLKRAVRDAVAPSVRN